MKKSIFLFLFTACFFVLKATAQDAQATDSTATFSIADSSTFTGKYKYEGLPFDYMEITVKDGGLFYSGGEYNGPLTALAGKKDAFDAQGQAVFTFVRNDTGKITSLQIDYNGQTFSGEKEEQQ